MVLSACIPDLFGDIILHLLVAFEVPLGRVLRGLACSVCKQQVRCEVLQAEFEVKLGSCGFLQHTGMALVITNQ